MTSKPLHASAVKHQADRLARNPHSLEAVECLAAEIESLTPTLPPAVRDCLAAVRGWANERRAELVMSCEGMVRHIAHHNYGRSLLAAHIDFDDAVQESMLGLTHAADLFDEKRGWQFTTYATCWIRQSLQRLVDHQGLIRVPVGRKGTVKNGEDLGDENEPDEFAEYVDRARRITRLSEIHGSLEDGDGSPGEAMIPDRGRDHTETASLRAEIAALTRCLPERDRVLLELRYLVGLRLEECKAEMARRGVGHVSKQRLQQLLKRALRRMRAQAGVA